MSNTDIEVAETAFSIFAAARECPERLCVRAFGRDYTFAEVAECVRQDLKTLELPAAGRPYILKARSDFATLVRIYALLEKRIPMLLLSPKLTDIEVAEFEALAQSIRDPLPPEAVAVLFTSGTTGRSKPAILTQKALLANAKGVSRHIGLTPEDVWQLSISPARVGGFGIITRSLYCRSAVALAPAYSAQNYLEAIEKDRITIASLVPTMLSDMLDVRPDWHPRAPLRLVLIGGAAFPKSVRQRAASAGVPVVTTYAMTETASTVAMSAMHRRFDADTGGNLPLEDVEMKSLEGELFVRGDMVMAGYWGLKPLEVNEWLDTGDRARETSDGGFEILGRKSDVLVSGGEKVYPDEVQKALESIDGIRQAWVAGLPDEKWGVIVTALLVADSEPISRDRLVKELKTRLARYKCPRRIAWVAAIPKTKEGKYAVTSDVMRALPLETVHYTSLNNKD